MQPSRQMQPGHRRRAARAVPAARACSARPRRDRPPCARSRAGLRSATGRNSSAARSIAICSALKPGSSAAMDEPVARLRRGCSPTARSSRRITGGGVGLLDHPQQAQLAQTLRPSARSRSRPPSGSASTKPREHRSQPIEQWRREPEGRDRRDQRPAAVTQPNRRTLSPQQAAGHLAPLRLPVDRRAQQDRERRNWCATAS